MQPDQNEIPKLTYADIKAQFGLPWSPREQRDAVRQGGARPGSPTAERARQPSDFVGGMDRHEA